MGGGQGQASYHTAMQKAVFDGDASNLEEVASTSGADAATVSCYLHPGLDGQQPGGCPTMYFRDVTATITNLAQHQLWVMLEAGAGIVSEHDYDATNGKWFNVTQDPFDSYAESPLWAFTKHRALNRLALRTKLRIESVAPVGSSTQAAAYNYTAYLKQNCYDGHGGAEIGGSPESSTDVAQCKNLCSKDPECSCVVFSAGLCWKRTNCSPKEFENDAATAPFAVYVKDGWAPAPPAPKVDGGALAYLKHDAMGPHGDAAIMVFNPGAAQQVTIDLSYLPAPLVEGTVPYDLFTNQSASTALTRSWTVEMRQGEAKAFGGFRLGVFAPRKGKTAGCDSGYSQASNATTLESCFMACAGDSQCQNVLINGKLPVYMETPAPISCVLLGAVDPATACRPAKTDACFRSDPSGCSTLVAKLLHARECAHRWNTPTLPAVGAPRLLPGPPCTSK